VGRDREPQGLGRFFGGLLRLPAGETLTFEAPLPPDLAATLRSLAER